VAGRTLRGLRLSVPSLIATLVAVAIWEALARTGVMPARWFPPATTVLHRLVQLAATSAYWSSVGDTLRGWGTGLLLASAVGVPLGLLIGSAPLLYRALRIPIEFFRPIPSVALIPLLVLVLGLGFSTKVFLAAFAALWPLLLQTIYGVQDVEPVLRDTMRSYGVGPLRRLALVTLPSAGPYIATGLRLASSIALILSVTAELTLGAPGIGNDVTAAQNGGASADLYALIVTAGVLGWLLSEGLRRGERRLLRWHPAYRAPENEPTPEAEGGRG
jgi:ABC-type nitrate/sulfonate/bicarbonate transport system permease component